MLHKKRINKIKVLGFTLIFIGSIIVLVWMPVWVWLVIVGCFLIYIGFSILIN